MATSLFHAKPFGGVKPKQQQKCVVPTHRVEESGSAPFLTATLDSSPHFLPL